MNRSDKAFLAAMAISLLTIIGITAFSFVHAKNFAFVTEAPCDPASQTCFHRDCSEPDACPPNGLEDYRVFTTSALDFRSCVDGSCAEQCDSGAIACEELVCGEGEEDECSEPVPPESDPIETDDETIQPTTQDPGEG